MAITALWKTLYTPGHDLACLIEEGGVRRLEGTAVYAREGVPTCLRYALELARDWSTLAASVNGLIGTKQIRIEIERDARGWLRNGALQPGVEDLADIDFGFTPATNLPQLRRMALAIGETKRITVAWMDVDSPGLEPLPQMYTRIAEDGYAYDSPQGGYHATLQIAPNGFVSTYPTLWQMEASLQSC